MRSPLKKKRRRGLVAYTDKERYNKNKTPERFQYVRFYKNVEVGKKLQEKRGVYVCNEKWRASYEKKNGGLSRAAARTGNLS